MVNMMLLALVDLINYQVPLLRRIAITHALTAALTTILMLVAIISILDGVDLKIGWVGVDSLVLIGLYFGGIWLIQRENRSPVEPVPSPSLPQISPACGAV
jgi:cation:H+ antiporter